MIEMKAELIAMPIHAWKHVPITVSRHKWWLKIHKIGDDGEFFCCFESPKRRRYSFWVELEKLENGHARVFNAEVSCANGETIARYCESWGDSPARMDALLRLTPKHIIDRLLMLLDAIG